MNTSNLHNIINQISSMSILLPGLHLDFSYEEFDDDVCFYYQHPPKSFVKSPFEVRFSRIDNQIECITSDNTPYITGIAIAQKPIIVNIFESALDAILEVDEVLIDYAIKRKMSSLLITKDGSGYFVQWLYNAYKEKFIIKNKPLYIDAAKNASAQNKKAFLKNENKLSLTLSIKDKQTLLFTSKGLVYLCFNCDLLSQTRICENCGDKQVTHFRADKDLTQILKQIPTSINNKFL